jgi:hypothetical protein
MNSNQGIPTESSRPKHPAGCIDRAIVARIKEIRRQTGRCAPVIHAQLLRDGFKVSPKSVQRTIRREGLAKPLPGYRRK